LNNIARPTKRALLVAIPLLCALLFAWLAGIEAYRWQRLNGPTAEAQASITAARRNPSRKAFGGPPYQLRYEFRVPSSDQTFHYTGQMLAIERWVRVPEATWESAQAKLISVRYALSDPRINQPASSALPTLLNAVGFLVFAILSFLGAVVVYRDRGGKSNNSFKPTPLRGAA